MKNYKYILSCLFLLVSSLLSAQKINEYLQIAAENNPFLKAKYADFEAAMQEVAQVNKLTEPRISFGYFISPVETRLGPQRAKIGLSQLFPWFGTLALKGEISTFQANAKYYEFLNAKNELYVKVKKSYYCLQELEAHLFLQKEYQSLLLIDKKMAMISFENGKSSMTDILLIDLAIDELNTKIYLLESQKKPFATAFKQLLNQDNLSIELDSLFLVAKNYHQDSLLSHPILKAFELKIQSLESTKKLVQKQSYPSIGLGLDYVIVGKNEMPIADNGRDVLMPMVSMSLPIYRTKYKAALKEIELKKIAITAYQEVYQNDLITQYEQALYEVEKANQLLALYTKQIKKLNQIISLLMVSYQNSGKDFEEILRMQEKLIAYKILEKTAIKEYLIATSTLDYLSAKVD